MRRSPRCAGAAAHELGSLTTDFLRPALLILGLQILLCGCGERSRQYEGSASCKACHARFYELWEPSHHGRALQSWSSGLAALVPPCAEPIEADGHLYRAFSSPEKGWVQDESGRQYAISYALGGKNYYNFLTLLEDGRLQVLPIFYDVREQRWRNTTLSMLRHFDDGPQDRPVPWRDPMLTFNAACFSCHVSQLESHYNPQTDTYATTWNEPGISCESCHGPASEHIRVCRAARPDRPPRDLRLISWKELSITQQNDSCSGCHAKAVPITAQFETGDRFWDHFDLTTFENIDYYPDGRDLGENYTLGSWLLSPCVTSGELSCTHCHTSSGRYRFKGEQANHACLPCHRQRVDNAAAHMHHPDGGATQCVQCHMPMNPFGGMNQSDHSMRPPLPQLSQAVGSRNACIQCHPDRDHDWALEQIRAWHPGFETRTAPELHRALLVKSLRASDWHRLPAALDFIADRQADPMFAATVIRLLPPSDAPRQRILLRELAAGAPHPLVRAAAATALDADAVPEDRPALIDALSDDSRLVRIRAAERLAALPENGIPIEHRKALARAVGEMWESCNLRLDHWSSHYNAGNIMMRQNRLDEAAAKFDRAHALRPDIPQPLINGAMAFARLGRLNEAENRLHQATGLPEPCAEAHFNLGLLHAELGRRDAAAKELCRTLELAPKNAAAACNLAILKAGTDYPETFRLLQQAIEADPLNPRYVHTLAFYYLETHQFDAAQETIRQARQRGVHSPEIQALLREILTRLPEAKPAR